MRLFSRRRMAGAAILLVWSGLLGAHVRREYFKPEAVRLAEGALSLAPGSEFYIVRLKDRAIGHAISRLDTVASGFVFDDVLTVDVPALDTVHRAVARTRVNLSHSLSLQGFAFSLDAEIGRFAVAGEVAGDTLLRLTVHAGGDAERSEVRLDPRMVLPTALPLRLAAGGYLEVGRELRVQFFDPSVLETRTATVRITATDTLVVPDSAAWDQSRRRYFAASLDTIPVWRVEEELGGIAVASWVDEDGRTVRAESPMGFTIERTEWELARQEWQASRADRTLSSGYGAIIESTAIASGANLGGSERTDALAVRLRGVDLTGFDLKGGRQSLRGDTLRIEREDLASLRPGYELPYRAGGPPAAELGSTPLIQAHDPRIIEAARRIAAGSTEPAVVARRLSEWVYQELKKEITPSVPSALQVLAARRGDCNEHTVLYVALARSLGLPTRTAAGLVHIRGRFYYHAWPEVWLGEWVAMDPTLGQTPADATHLRFIVGSLARQLELIRLIGRLQLEVI